MNKIEWYTKDNQVAILYSPGFGAGWSTWGDRRLAYDKRVVEKWFEIQEKLAAGERFSEMMDEMEEFIDSLPEYNAPYMGGLDKVQVEWVNKGDFFYIYDYDGHETLVVESDLMIAGGE